MPADFSLSPLIAATAQWLTRAYPTGGGALDRALAETQARQAVTVAAWLRYPTAMDAALVAVAGPGGSARLDWVTGADSAGNRGEEAWCTWVDEVVASWAASLLSTPGLAAAAMEALAGSAHLGGAPVEFRRLVDPDEHDRRAAALLRHPDLLAPIADLHREQLLDRLATGPASASLTG
ncbi:hypothetical protein AMK26_13590 [Streptomyces sp. CB03234]|uniref:hypothetical protein n=1 Tax=Streptomyces sp. (strain CB03234) TaxID=1703937 RepID=UPI00093CD9E0|nr:hypothetical protein [Streptomyces sp. CB03234]OKK04396.1 hypothetical protein AMK26_13590 [Streptomyces sp. CB03234]